MKSFWNFLRKNKLYGTINLVGLTVSMAFVLLLAVYIQRQLSTDSFQENADRVFVIGNDNSVQMGYWLDKHLKNNFPERDEAHLFILSFIDPEILFQPVQNVIMLSL